MLCGVEGFGVMRVAPQKDGSYRVFNRELAFYREPKTDEFIDAWTNPLTGETCEVSPIHNRIVNATVAPIVRQDFDGHVVERPFDPSWTFLEGQAFQVFELHAAFPNPMKVADWPRESSGPVSRLSEIFQRSCRIADLDDPKPTSVPCRSGRRASLGRRAPPRPAWIYRPECGSRDRSPPAPPARSPGSPSAMRAG